MVAEPTRFAGEKAGLQRLDEVFQSQRTAFRRHPMPSADERRVHLGLVERLLREHGDQIVKAIHDDFGNRARAETLTSEILIGLEAVKYARKKLKSWMRPSHRSVGRLMLSTRAKVIYQPLGVVGILVPWNYPIQLSIVPLIYALAAGNRVMIKPSESTPQIAALLDDIVGRYFAADHVAIVPGEVEVGVAFTKMPFDHLLFTGSTDVGRHVMRAAADNLTPVTLELGGKSPTIISHDAPMALVAERIGFGKTLNAGQSCVAPDHVFCPRERVEEFVEHMQSAVAKLFPTLRDNPDYTCVINDRHYERLHNYLHDARKKGARIVEINPAGEELAPHSRRMALHLVLDVQDDMLLAREEMFGPVLPVMLYDHLDEVIANINDQPRPLALHYFGFDRAGRKRILEETHAGTVCFNDAMFHVAIDDLPFGGVGASGMGSYHGPEGFRTFSHGKAVYSRPRLNSARPLYPPYGGRLQQFLLKLFMK